MQLGADYSTQANFYSSIRNHYDNPTRILSPILFTTKLSARCTRRCRMLLRLEQGLADSRRHSSLGMLTPTEYAQRWDEIAGIFSRDAVLKGSFDKFAAST